MMAAASRLAILLAALTLAAGADLARVEAQATGDLYSNYGRFDLPEYNAPYDRAKRLPNGPERAKLYREMSRLVVAYASWVLHTYRIENIIVPPWVEGYKFNTFDPHPWVRLDLDLAQRQRATR
jgi:ABC-type transport system substrate-binding protein